MAGEGLTWLQIKAELERRLKDVDKKLRRAEGNDVLSLQGRSQQLEELLHLPEAMKLQGDVDA